MKTPRTIKGRSIDGKDRKVVISYARWVCITVVAEDKIVAVEVPYRELRTALRQVSPPKPIGRNNAKASKRNRAATRNSD